MVLEPYTSLSDSDDPNTEMPYPAIRMIATVEDTLELYPQEGEATAAAPAKVNKWHEKFAKGRKS